MELPQWRWEKPQGYLTKILSRMAWSTNFATYLSIDKNVILWVLSARISRVWGYDSDRHTCRLVSSSGTSNLKPKRWQKQLSCEEFNFIFSSEKTKKTPLLISKARNTLVVSQSQSGNKKVQLAPSRKWPCPSLLLENISRCFTRVPTWLLFD